MTGDLRKKLAALVAALLVAGGIVVTVAIDDDGPDGPKPPRTVTIRVDGADADRKADDKVAVPTAMVKAADKTDVGDHDGERSEAPPGVTPKQLEESRQKQDELAANDRLPEVQPDAAPSQRGCASKFVVNASSRHGVAPRLLVAHYTVSPNVAGWSDVNSITALFNRPAFQASSNYVIDAEGHCNYIVRESDKAWTQAGLNPYSISIEFINSGREASLAGKAGLAKGALVFADAARRWKIPVRRGAVSGCVPTRSGIVQHKDLGACGGGHFDVSPYSVQSLVTATKRARGGSSAVKLTKGERRDIACLRRHKGEDATPPCENRLRDRNLELHKLGLTSKNDRARRHTAIHAALRRYS